MPTVFANGSYMMCEKKNKNDAMVLDHSKWKAGDCHLLKCI